MLLSLTPASVRRGGAAVAISCALLGLPISPLGCAHGIDLDLQPLPGDVGSSGAAPAAGVGVGSAGAGGAPSGGAGGRGDAQGVGGMGSPSSSVGAGGATAAGGSQPSGGAAGSTPAGAGGSSGAGGATAGASGASGASMDGGAGSGGMSGDAGRAGSGGQGGAAGSAGMGGAGGMILRDAGPPVSVDDSVVGTGTNQFNYVGTWMHCNPCTTATTPPLFNMTNSWADGSDAGPAESLTFTFVGQQISLYAVLDPRNGIGAASIDGSAESLVDFYATARAGNRLLWTSPIFARGTHSFKLRVTGTRNTASSGLTVVVDRVDVQ